MNVHEARVVGPHDGRVGFERFFGELVDLGGVGGVTPETLADLCA